MQPRKQKQQIVNYLFGQDKIDAVDDANDPGAGADVPYAFNDYNKFLDENGNPAISHPGEPLPLLI
ncbi:hypothetical protein [Niabella aquatica]